MPNEPASDVKSEAGSQAEQGGVAARAPEGLRLFDLMGLVVGYSSAALLMRALWPPASLDTAGHAVAALLEYAWLGLAMSGPIIAGSRRRGGLRLSGAEIAWFMIGAYWIGLAVLAVPHPVRLHAGLVLACHAAILVTAAVFPRKASRAIASERRWTRTAAVALLATFPVAWLIYILLCSSL